MGPSVGSLTPLALFEPFVTRWSFPVSHSLPEPRPNVITMGSEISSLTQFSSSLSSRSKVPSYWPIGLDPKSHESSAGLYLLSHFKEYLVLVKCLRISLHIALQPRHLIIPFSSGLKQSGVTGFPQSAVAGAGVLTTGVEGASTFFSSSTLAFLASDISVLSRGLFLESPFSTLVPLVLSLDLLSFESDWHMEAMLKLETSLGFGPDGAIRSATPKLGLFGDLMLTGGGLLRDFSLSSDLAHLALVSSFDDLLGLSFLDSVLVDSSLEGFGVTLNEGLGQPIGLESSTFALASFLAFSSASAFAFASASNFSFLSASAFASASSFAFLSASAFAFASASSFSFLSASAFALASASSFAFLSASAFASASFLAFSFLSAFAFI